MIRKHAKVLFLGDGAVGKTSLVTLISLTETKNKEECKEPKVTVGFDIHTHCFLHEESKIEVVIWDFGGQPQFRFYQKDFMGLAIVGVLVFDLTRLSSLLHLKEWRSLAETTSKFIRFIVVGNKLDSSDRSVPSDMASSFASSIGAPYIETSARSLAGVQKLMKTIEELIIEVSSVS